MTRRRVGQTYSLLLHQVVLRVVLRRVVTPRGGSSTAPAASECPVLQAEHVAHVELVHPGSLLVAGDYRAGA